MDPIGPKARPARAFYRRNLPHFQVEAKPLFVTFATKDRWELPESVRGAVLGHCLHDHGTRIRLHAAVVMPNHVHLLFSALRDPQGNPFGLAQIMSGIKGASSHRVNKMLGRRGTVWQDESFDHILRSDEQLDEKAAYLCTNPVRRGLVENVEDYPWIWREWVEGSS